MAAFRTFAGLFIIPAKGNDLPETSRMQPVW
jgi:magnesium-protoporphyrin IX monomethyl ester (oxidative) cyclase